MINTVLETDLDMRLRCAETREFLARYRNASHEDATVGLAFLDRAMMQAFGDRFVLIEPHEEDAYRILYAGRAIKAALGDALEGRSTEDLAPHAGAVFRLGADTCLNAGDAIGILHRAAYAAIDHRWECLFIPIREQGERRMVVALCVVQETKEAFLRNLLDSMPDGVLAAGPVRCPQGEIIDATIIAINRQAAEFVGVKTPESLLETSLLALFGPKVAAGWDRHLLVLRSGKTQIFDHHIRHETNSIWLRCVSSPISEGILVSLTDITDMRRQTLELEHQRKMLMEEMDHRRNLEQELWTLAHLDSLTALPNRRAFRESAALRIAEAQARSRPCALIAGDIDHFKRINDAYGHGAGDTVLRRIADIIKAPLRPNTDIGARMGGEEFAILLADTEPEAAVHFAEMLRKRVEQTIIVTSEFEIRPTISLGVAIIRKDLSLDELIENADRALYCAKRSGRNCVSTEMDVQGKQSAA
jgi:diguanylate cyclase (GGDEF)-like protein